MKKRRWLAALIGSYLVGRHLGRWRKSAGQKRGYSESRSAFIERVTRPHMSRVRVHDRDYGEEATELQGRAA